MSGLRVYPSKFKGPVMLVCRKCQKKLKGERTWAAKLKKALRRLGKRDPEPVRFHMIGVGCMKLCPKGGVAVCSQSGLRATPPGLTLVRTKEDVAELYEAGRAYSGLPSGAGRT